MARLDIRELEVIASNRIISERKRRSFSDNLPLNLSVFTETLSGMSFFNTHGVLARRMGVIGLEFEQQRLEQSLQRIGECANSGAWPSLAEIREILHPPFESFSDPSIRLGSLATWPELETKDEPCPEGPDAQIEGPDAKIYIFPGAPPTQTDTQQQALINSA